MADKQTAAASQEPGEDPGKDPGEDQGQELELEPEAPADDGMEMVTITAPSFHPQDPPAGLFKRPYQVGTRVLVGRETKAWMKACGVIGPQRKYTPPERKAKNPRGRRVRRPGVGRPRN